MKYGLTIKTEKYLQLEKKEKARKLRDVLLNQNWILISLLELSQEISREMIWQTITLPTMSPLEMIPKIKHTLKFMRKDRATSDRDHLISTKEIHLTTQGIQVIRESAVKLVINSCLHKISLELAIIVDSNKTMKMLKKITTAISRYLINWLLHHLLL